MLERATGSRQDVSKSSTEGKHCSSFFGSCFLVYLRSARGEAGIVSQAGVFQLIIKVVAESMGLPLAMLLEWIWGPWNSRDQHQNCPAKRSNFQAGLGIYMLQL